MFEAHLSDPAHGEVTKQAPTKQEAVELAFRELARSWMYPNDIASWSADTQMFDGEIRDNGEVWWHNRAWGLIGTVRQIS